MNLSDSVRLRIQDPWRWDEEQRVGDGTGSAFKLKQGSPHSNVSAASAFVVGSDGGWSATGAAFETALGLVTFSGRISANTAWKAIYQWSVFSDEQIGQFTAVGGDVLGASLEAIRTLMFDGLKRARWMAADGTQYDDTAALSLLKNMYELLKEEQREAPAGGIESWTEQQAHYSNEYNA